jgi:hypothetical protein
LRALFARALAIATSEENLARGKIDDNLTKHFAFLASRDEQMAEVDAWQEAVKNQKLAKRSSR